MPLSAWALKSGLELQPPVIEFGPVPVGAIARKSFAVKNVSSAAVVVDRVGLAPGSSAEFSLLKAQSTSRTLAPGESARYSIEFAPSRDHLVATTVDVKQYHVAEPLRLAVRGEGTTNCDTADCAPPIAQCPPPATATVNRPYTLQGRGWDARGPTTACEWSVVSGPAKSTSDVSPASQCTTSIIPDLIGTYVLQLRVIGSNGLLGGCQTTLTAVPPGGLWVEMFWSDPCDVDLWLQHPNGGDPTLASSWALPYACGYSSKRPSWDAPGTADDPSLDRDDTGGTGPENIRIDEPTPGIEYAVGVHWYRSDSLRQVAATTNVYCNLALLHTEVVTLTAQKEFVLLGTVRSGGPSQCTWTPRGVRFTK